MSPAVDRSLSGKVCLVTGASAGIGKEVARGLASRGACVVLGVRHVSRGEAARADIVMTDGQNLDVEVMQLDVCSMANIRDFVERFRKHHPKLHVLVNNAACWQMTREVSAEGIELTWATNVLGPYLLTGLLLEPLRSAAPSQIVNVVSTAAGGLDLEDVQFEKRGYSGFRAYSQSKQALRMLTWGLAKRLEGTGVTANAVNPGFVRTELNRNARGVTGALMPILGRLLGKTPAQGARAVLRVATGPELEGVSGKFFSGHKVVPCQFNDPAQIQRLERICAEMVQRAAPARGSAELEGAPPTL